MLSERERFKLGWREMISRYGFDCFFTLTFKYPAQSPELAIDRAKSLLTEFYNSAGGTVAAFVVAEEHKLGTYHAHGLLRLGVSNPYTKALYCDALWSLAKLRCGLSRFEVIRELDKCESYITKYILKDIADYRWVGKGLYAVGVSER